MKVLMLNTFDTTGGAARAAARLQRGALALGIDVRMLVQFKNSNAEEIICNKSPLQNLVRRLKLFLGLLPVRRYPNKPVNNFSPALIPDHIPSELAEIDPDIIHLHWLCAGFLSVETIGKLYRLNKPLIWTLHDSWAFTGGCHVPFDCTRYQKSCGACPILGSSREKDLSRWTWTRKEKAWKKLNLTIVTPSRWLADCALSSSLLKHTRIEVIPNGLDADIFQPRDKMQSRRLLKLPENRKIILFGAVGVTTDLNKGFHLLKGALNELSEEYSDLQAVVFGTDMSPLISDLQIPVRALGSIGNDQELAIVYSAADIFVAPSLQENLPNTIMEAMACGTPCVAFRQGGVPELIAHKVSGYLANPYDTNDLARGITWILEDRSRHEKLASQARLKVVADFQLCHAAQKYNDLYVGLLGKGQ
jgi:glycosyltransferase involved in cell wall biosynthesis